MVIKILAIVFGTILFIAGWREIPGIPTPASWAVPAVVLVVAAVAVLWVAGIV